MKISIVSSQILGLGKIGGFGSMTKKLALALINDGHEVSIIIPSRTSTSEIFEDSGMKIYTLSKKDLLKKEIYKKINSDVYHSQNPNALTLMAQKAEPNKIHVITCRDPRDNKDWLNEFQNATIRRKIKTIPNYFFEAGPLVSRSIRKAHLVGVPAVHLQEKVQKMYKLKKLPILLPNLETIPDDLPEKSASPTVCYVGRLDKRKRPELIIELAKDFPQVNFLIVGEAEEAARQKELEDKAAPFSNIQMLGAIDKFKDSDRFWNIYNQSWIFVNTASREGLPLTFIEAAGRGCAILSFVNPDQFPEKFGYWAAKEDFSNGLKSLLKNNHWEPRGKLAYQYVKSVYDENKALQVHLDWYQKLIKA